MFRTPEKVTTFLVEVSPHTETYLKSIQDGLIDFLYNQNHGNHSLAKFNLGYFSREFTFWADEVIECSSASVRSAAEWIRTWSLVTSKTPRGPLVSERNSGFMLPALVAALGDPFSQSVCLYATSMPKESMNDLVSHTRLSSKDRPIHVTFLAAQSRVDYRTMEILHLLCRETGGRFQVAYFSPDGRLADLVQGSQANFPTPDTPSLFGGREAAPISPNSMEFYNKYPTDMLSRNDQFNVSQFQPRPVLNGSDDINDFEKELKRSQAFLNKSSGFMQFYRKVANATIEATGPQKPIVHNGIASPDSGFSDLKFSLDRDIESDQHINFSDLGDDTKLSARNTTKYFNLTEDALRYDEGFQRMEKKLESEFESAKGAMSRKQFEEMKKLFVRSYMSKKRKEHKKKNRQKFKTIGTTEFKFPFEDKNKSTDSDSDTSYTSSSSSDSGSKRKSSRRQKHRPLRIKSNSFDTAAGLTSRSSKGPELSTARRAREKKVDPPITGRNTSRTTTTHRGLWLPSGRSSSVVGTSRIYTNPPLAENKPTDRSSEWMSGFQNSMVKRQFPNDQRKMVNSVGTQPQPQRLHRPQSAPNKLNMTIYTQTEKNVPTWSRKLSSGGDNDTIRKLVTQNEKLVDVLVNKDRIHEIDQRKEAMSHWNRTHAPVKPPPSNSVPSNNPSFYRLPKPVQKSVKQHEQIAGVCNAKKSLNDEIKQLQQGRFDNSQAREEGRINGLRQQRNRYQELVLDRNEQIGKQLERRDAIKQQRQQQAYKAMYNQLKSEVDKKQAEINGKMNKGTDSFTPNNVASALGTQTY